jgi:hypothetical protein
VFISHAKWPETTIIIIEDAGLEIMYHGEENQKEKNGNV